MTRVVECQEIFFVMVFIKLVLWREGGGINDGGFPGPLGTIGLNRGLGWVRDAPFAVITSRCKNLYLETQP